MRSRGMDKPTGRGSNRKLLCAAVVLTIVLVCAASTMVWWPMYYAIINDVLPRRAALLENTDGTRPGQGVHQGVAHSEHVHVCSQLQNMPTYV